MNYLTVKEIISSELEVKGSKFLSFLIPFSDFDSQLQLLKTEHPKASHFVYAYRYLNQNNQAIENLSDDGEPKGSSGKPTLLVLQGENLINVGIITIRYFGGTKLGVGGLMRAYSESAHRVIKNASLISYSKLIEAEIDVLYSLQNQILYHLNIIHATIVDRDFQSDFVKIKFLVEEKNLGLFENIVKDQNFNIKIKVID